MKIVSYMCAAFQQFMHGVDVGIDLSKEYPAGERRVTVIPSVIT